MACALPGAGATPQDPARPTSKLLLDTAGKTAPHDLGISPTSSEVTVALSPDPAMPGVVATIQPGKESYPGIHYVPARGPWDLSTFGHVRARIVNLGEKPALCNLRIDGKTDDGEWGSNTETVLIEPGKSGVAQVYFGYTYGNKPGPKLNPRAIEKVVLFGNKSDVVQTIRLESIEAGGPPGETPPIKPENLRIKPNHGVILGGGTSPDELRVEAKEGALASWDGDALALVFPGDNRPKWVCLKPKIGRWDFREAFGVRVTFKNVGTTPCQLMVRVNSNGGPTDLATTTALVAAGAEGEIEVPFAPKTSWLGIKNLNKTSWDGQQGTGTKFTSDSVTDITLSGEGAGGDSSVSVTEVTAGKLAQRDIPDWVGKRPPIEGDWVKTFEDNFDGKEVDLTKWNVHTENYWDKRSHFSKDNVIVKDGVAKLHYEKKTGHENDDPSRKQTAYTTGFLDTYGKWVQRYGYFESRMKLTKAPGLWPAFWVMPDRGADAGPQWKRADTGNGGMEFDVMEFLGRWGGYRYNVAWHWDGYGEDHKTTGSQNIYFQPDEDGFITAGLLWLPGVAVVYANGQEVARLETPRISTVPSDIMFTNVSGGWDNDAIDDALLPDDFVIDYVRVWQRKDLASEVDTVSPVATP